MENFEQEIKIIFEKTNDLKKPNLKDIGLDIELRKQQFLLHIIPSIFFGLLGLSTFLLLGTLLDETIINWENLLKTIVIFFQNIITHLATS